MCQHFLRCCFRALRVGRLKSKSPNDRNSNTFYPTHFRVRGHSFGRSQVSSPEVSVLLVLGTVATASKLKGLQPSVADLASVERLDCTTRVGVQHDILKQKTECNRIFKAMGSTFRTSRSNTSTTLWRLAGALRFYFSRGEIHLRLCMYHLLNCSLSRSLFLPSYKLSHMRGKCLLRLLLESKAVGAM